MELGITAILAVSVLVAVAVFAKRLGVAAPIVLVLAGVGLSFLPGVPEVVVPHEWVLDGVLPPLLYAAAISVPFIDFRRNLATITGLSVVLVVLSAAGVGALLFALLPALGLPLAIAVGAIISPPDAVAATSVGRRLGLPPRLLTLLEGEGLINDATALVLLRSALAAAAGTLATPWAAVGDFLYAVVVAVVVGLVASVVTVFVRSRLEDPVLNTVISFIVPFVAFIPAEGLGASGVLAVVVAGLHTGHASSRAFTAQSRVNDRINWRTVQFLLENGVFLLIGLEIRSLIQDADSAALTVPAAVGIGLIATLGLIVVRFAWVGPVLLGERWQTQRAERRARRQKELLDSTGGVRLPREKRRKARERFELRKNDYRHFSRNDIGWRGGVVLGWSGMRGVVTLAAAQSLPEDTPYRPQLVLIAFTVAVTTLLVQGSTLPLLIRATGIRGVDVPEDQRALAGLLDEITEKGLSILESPGDVVEGVAEVDPDVLERVRQTSFLRSEAAWERSRGARRDVADTPHRLYRALRLAVVTAEREALLDARSRRAYPQRILAQAQSMLDLEETRLRLRRGTTT
ncbi:MULTISPECIES: cation:proton antiporter [unclassified Rathayibacter]|uniref:cation:proton antiporter n=1 Tax=unclassified Rathayibacter TaxID=2609250 RepID=UPI0006F4C4DB|nr:MULTISPECIES: cation:proton antiporter [unclassified Rathayibacter]KQQ06170.1 sodium:proton antiporter [Rathayibacter sp. Leaf294]KQS14027.1 sodium:proton antiporter [Rathayibacter sp. Leaf185]